MPLNKQPHQAAGVDWGNTITKGLIFAAYPIGGVMVDMVSRKRGDLLGTTPPILGGSSTGRNLYFSGGGATTSNLAFGADAATADMHINGGTWFFWCRPGSSGGLAERNDGNAVNVGWAVGVGSANQLSFLKEYSSRNMSVVSTSAVPINQYCSLAVTYDGVGTSSGVGFYINGIGDTPVFVFTGSGSQGSDLAYPLRIGRVGFGGGASGQLSISSFLGNIELALFFKRVLSDRELMSLHQNRYQVFAPPRGRRYVGQGVLTASPSLFRPQVFVCT